MKTKMKWTVLAVAISAFTASAAATAADDQDASADINHQHLVNEVRNWDETNTVTNTNTNTNVNLNANVDVNASLNYTDNQTNDVTNTDSRTYTSNITNGITNTENYLVDESRVLNSEVNNTENYLIGESRVLNSEVNNTENYSIGDHSYNSVSNTEVYENVQKTSNISADERKEKNNHGVDVNLEKDLRLSSDIKFTGEVALNGDITVDSAAIAVVDNRQYIAENYVSNSLVTNDASIGDDVGANASGNLGFNVAAGDNNAQDNAASLSAADASFSFGMADAEVFVNQSGMSNITENSGVTNAAGVGGNAFAGAAGNIGVNVTSGNNNQQKNALAASVATSAYATASISSNQVSIGNETYNEGSYEQVTNSYTLNLSGTVSGGVDLGEGSYAGTGNSYQKTNFYPDTYTESGSGHANGNRLGHDDWDIETQGAVANPNRPGVGGMAWDTDEAGKLSFDELGTADLVASLSGTVTDIDWVAKDAINTASLSGSAFSGASGNIGVNVSSGTGNLQANSLALAVAQPSTGGAGGGGESP